MALPDSPLTRGEQYLNRTATGSGTIPDEPLTRVEMYLNKIATGDGTWVFGYGSTVSGASRVTVYKATTSKKRQVLKETVRSQFKPFRESF